MCRISKHSNVIAALLLVLMGGTSALIGAQWSKYPSPGAPRTPRGEVDLSAATPRLANGKPDFSGVWMTADPPCGRVGGPASVTQLLQLAPPSQKCPVRGPTMSREGINMGVDLPGGLPYQPWLAALVQERISTLAKDDPHIKCLPDLFLRAYGLPHYLKFAHTPGLVVMLNEMNGVYRQVFTDGRPLPKDPNPSWQGYSSAAWSGDTLVVDTIGFRDDLWI